MAEFQVKRIVAENALALTAGEGYVFTTAAVLEKF